MADGVVQYGLYLKEDGKKKTVNVYEARTYVNKEYAERSERAGKAQEVIISGMVAGSVKVIQGGIKIIIGAGKIITG